jgi:hypothetical protein
MPITEHILSYLIAYMDWAMSGAKWAILLKLALTAVGYVGSMLLVFLGAFKGFNCLLDWTDRRRDPEWYRILKSR